MSVDALQLKDYFIQEGIESKKAGTLAKGIRDYVNGIDLASKKDLKVEIANAKLQIVGYTVTIQTIIMALFDFFGR